MNCKYEAIFWVYSLEDKAVNLINTIYYHADIYHYIEITESNWLSVNFISLYLKSDIISRWYQQNLNYLKANKKIARESE